MVSLIHRKTRLIPWGLVAVHSLCFATVYGCDVQLAQPPVAADEKKVEAVGCRVSGRIISSAWRDRGGGIERAIVSAWTLPEMKRVEQAYGEGERFELRLPPGKYRITLSANGTRGATFEVESREITLAGNQDSFDLGVVDLPISKNTSLYGQPAPELHGIIAWHDTTPIALKDLRGKVVVLDFFAWYCSICHAHKPDLVKLRDKYQGDGLVVLALHDPSLKTLDEMNAKMGPVLRQVFKGDPPKLAMGLDGMGEKSTFAAYGIQAVPAVILIDKRGRIVRRYHHAGKPELEADVRASLKERSQPVQ